MTASPGVRRQSRSRALAFGRQQRAVEPRLRPPVDLLCAPDRDRRLAAADRLVEPASGPLGLGDRRARTALGEADAAAERRVRRRAESLGHALSHHLLDVVQLGVGRTGQVVSQRRMSARFAGVMRTPVLAVTAVSGSSSVVTMPTILRKFCQRTQIGLPL